MHELLFKSLKVSAKISTLKFETDHPEERKRVIALTLLSGGYNPMRKHSDTGTPIDIEKLREYESELDWLLTKVAKEMDVNINEIQEL